MTKKKYLFSAILIILVVTSAAVLIFLNTMLPQRSGEINIPGLNDKVNVIFDEWGVPHIYASNEEDAYRALGYLHAQDRLFQMEITRRLAKGELAEILGSSLLDTDRFFRTLRIKGFSKEYAEIQDKKRPAVKLGEAYIKGINHFIETGPAPVEFRILGIPKRPFTLEDSVAIGGYISYSFATAFKTDPLLTYIRDTLGTDYLKDMAYEREGKNQFAANNRTIDSMAALALLVIDIEKKFAPAGLFEGSNAWVVSGSRTESGKPILASDPHIAFSVPAVWYEAHIITPGFEFYGHYLAGVPIAMMGHNSRIGWGITMFKNDDVDFFIEKSNPDNRDQVWNRGRWEDLTIEDEVIKVKGADDVHIKVRRSKHGPLVNDVLKELDSDEAPVSMWWAYHEKNNRMFEAFHSFAHAETVYDMERAAKKLYAPGINVIAADNSGNIAWWGIGRIPERAPGANPNFIMESGKDDYRGFRDFSRHPQSINPPSGYIVSSNHRPEFKKGDMVPGYYNIPYRAKRIEELLAAGDKKWTMENTKQMQLDNITEFHVKIRDAVLPFLEGSEELQGDKNALEALALFKNWKGDHTLESKGPVIFFQFYYDLMESAFKDDLGEKYFEIFLGTKMFEKNVPLILSNPESPWWNLKDTEKKETMGDIIVKSWLQCVRNLESDLGANIDKWSWGRVHSIELKHPLGRKKPLNKIFNEGPYTVPGAREVVNNLGFDISGGHHHVNYGPSTRRIIDFAHTENSMGISPMGQSGYFFDTHYNDQTGMFINGEYRKQLMNEDEIKERRKSTLVLFP